MPRVGDPGSGGGGGGSSPAMVLPQLASVRMNAANIEWMFSDGLTASASPEQGRITVSPGYAGEARGDLSFRGISGWQRLETGTIGQVLRTGGPGTDPAWVSIPSSYCFLAPSAPTAWAVPLLLTEFLTTTVARVKADLTTAGKVRLMGRLVTGGLAGSELRLQYSTDESTWDYLDGVSGPSISLTSAGLITSSWLAPTVSALADVFLRLIGINGNGITAPTFGVVAVEVA